MLAKEHGLWANNDEELFEMMWVLETAEDCKIDYMRWFKDE